MNKEMNKEKVTIIIFCLFLPLFLLLLSYQLTLQFYPQTENQQQTIKFVQGRTQTISLQNNFNYTSAEFSHLQDVEKVMSTTEYLFLISLLTTLTILGINFHNKLFLKKLLRYGGIATLIATGMVLLFLLFAFGSSFTIFHQLFFPQGNWQFPFNSLLIQTFPLDFFISVSKTIFIQALIYGILFIGGSFLFRNGTITRRFV